MEISELTLKLILLLIPGAIASVIFEKLTIHKPWTPFQFIANSVLFGGISYLLAQFLFGSLLGSVSLDNFWANLPTKDIPFDAIAYGMFCSILVGFLFAYLDQIKVINKIGKHTGISTKYGDENLFTYFLNSDDVSEIYVRDRESGLTYHGVLQSFSETAEFKELLLIDAKIYSYEDSTLYYSVPHLYLSKPKDSVVIETAISK